MCNLYNVVVQIYTFQLTFQNFTTIFLHSSITKKSYGVRHSVRTGSNPRRRPRLSYLPPHLRSHYTTWGKNTRRRRKNYARCKKICGGRRNIREQQRTAGGGRGWAKKSEKISQSRNLSRSAKKALS